MLFHFAHRNMHQQRITIYIHNEAERQKMCYIFTINNFLKKDYTRVILQSSCSLLWLLNRSACQLFFPGGGGESNAFINARNKPYYLVKRSSLFKYSVPLRCFRFRLLSLLRLYFFLGMRNFEDRNNFLFPTVASEITLYSTITG